MPTRGDPVRNAETRGRILDAAERLFAEHGVHGVSNRAVAEAAGQGNTAVVGYHFGTKADLVRAIVRRHTAAIERAREDMLAAVTNSDEVRDWLDCLVRPTADHLAVAKGPTWYARFAAQLITDPALAAILTDEAFGSPSLTRLVEGLDACLTSLPRETRLERAAIGRILQIHVFAERERALADGAPTPRASWEDTATGLVDALVGVWLAPVTARRRADRSADLARVDAGVDARPDATGRAGGT